MKRLLHLLAAVGCIASVAGAAPVFDIAPDLNGSLGFYRGERIWVDIIGTSPTDPNGFQGLELYLVVQGPFLITDVLIDLPGCGTGFEGNSTGAHIDFTNPGAAIAMVTTASGFIPAGSIVARVQIQGGGSVGSTGMITTDGTDYWGAPSNFADGQVAVQDTLHLYRYPEPTTALLLLAGVPLVRRRPASPGNSN